MEKYKEFRDVKFILLSIPEMLHVRGGDGNENGGNPPPPPNPVPDPDPNAGG